MKTTIYVSCASLAFLLPLSAQDQEAVISRDTISVHTAERGNMPLRERAAGSITSLEPPRAILRLAGENAERCEPGQKATIQIDPPSVIAGKVVKGSQAQDELRRCEIELSDPLPAGTKVGKSVGGLIEVGELKDVVFFGRPADSLANSVATIFVLEAGNDFARRVTVRYGKISGALIEVVKGVSPGDRVIVTDMSKWAKYQRVRLQ
jgi:HlyD family secretion protein